MLSVKLLSLYLFYVHRLGLLSAFEWDDSFCYDAQLVKAVKLRDRTLSSKDEHLSQHPNHHQAQKTECKSWMMRRQIWSQRGCCSRKFTPVWLPMKKLHKISLAINPSWMGSCFPASPLTKELLAVNLWWRKIHSFLSPFRMWNHL